MQEFARKLLLGKTKEKWSTDTMITLQISRDTDFGPFAWTHGGFLSRNTPGLSKTWLKKSPLDVIKSSMNTGIVFVTSKSSYFSSPAFHPKQSVILSTQKRKSLYLLVVTLPPCIFVTVHYQFGKVTLSLKELHKRAFQSYMPVRVTCDDQAFPTSIVLIPLETKSSRHALVHSSFSYKRFITNWFEDPSTLFVHTSHTTDVLGDPLERVCFNTPLPSPCPNISDTALLEYDIEKEHKSNEEDTNMALLQLVKDTLHYVHLNHDSANTSELAMLIPKMRHFAYTS